jgi:hypothetical protein
MAQVCAADGTVHGIERLDHHLSCCRPRAHPTSNAGPKLTAAVLSRPRRLGLRREHVFMRKCAFIFRGRYMRVQYSLHRCTMLCEIRVCSQRIALLVSAMTACASCSPVPAVTPSQLAYHTFSCLWISVQLSNVSSSDAVGGDSATDMVGRAARLHDFITRAQAPPLVRVCDRATSDRSPSPAPCFTSPPCFPGALPISADLIWRGCFLSTGFGLRLQ